MKHPQWLVLFFFLGSFSLGIQAQEKNLESLPQKERDSILMAVAKEAIMIYGPGYYRDHEPPQISFQGACRWLDPIRDYYIVTYPVDSTREELVLDFSAVVYIWADTPRAFKINFGNSIGISFHDVDYQHVKVEQVPYQQKKDMPKPRRPIPKELDDPSLDDRRDSLLIRWTRDLILKEHAPGYYRDFQKPEITMEHCQDTGWYHGKKYYRLTSYYDKKKEHFDKEYSVAIEVWNDYYIRKILFGNGIEISMERNYVRINRTERTRYTGAFFIPFKPSGLKTDATWEIMNLDKLSNEARHSLLVQRGKEVALAICPSYYREYQQPLTDTITRVNVGDGQSRLYYHPYSPSVVEEYWNRADKNFGRKYYRIYFWNGKEDSTSEPRSVQVSFWADNGQAFRLLAGNEVTVIFDGLDFRKIGEIIPFQDRKKRHTFYKWLTEEEKEIYPF